MKAAVIWVSDSLDHWVVQPLAAILCGSVAIIIIMQVFFRFVLNSPLSWAEEAARYLMIWTAALGGSTALRLGAHTAFEGLHDNASLPIRWLMRSAVFVTVQAFLWILLIKGIEVALFNSIQRSAALGIPMMWPYLAIPCAAAIMIIHSLRIFLVGKHQPQEHGQ
jgi:TRAP-type C4-dicarboxylate transport system permease small subunit